LTGVQKAKRTSAKLLLGIGALWLLLAGAILVYQFVSSPQVEITWETATEVDTAGFFLYRGDSPEGEFTPLNGAKLIDSRGSPQSGAAYSFVDNTVSAGRTYYYLLEEVEIDASKNRYDGDLLTYKVPFVSWWALALTALSLFVGLVMLMAGIREGRRA
jgi:hypothetical protein